MSVDVSLQLHRDSFELNAAFSAPARGVTAVSGPSGSGKTTLLRAIAGLEAATGSVSVRGETWQDEHNRLPVHARGVGYVFQEPSLFPHLNVQGNLDYGRQRRSRRAPVNGKAPDFATVIDMLRLGDLLDRASAQLSGGEQQRVAIGRALLAHPQLLLMDEPLASLDSAHKRELLPFLEVLHRELDIPVLYVSHAADEVARLADHIVLLENGRTVASGAVTDMLTRLDLPLARDEAAATVVAAAPVDYDAAFDLTRMRFSGGDLQIPGDHRNAGAGARVRIMARDVSITLAAAEATSILNIVPVEITEISRASGAQCTVRLRAGTELLLARITRRSLQSLALQPGMQVWAQIKSAALLGS